MKTYLYILSLSALVGGAGSTLSAQERPAHTSQFLKANTSSYTQVLYRADTDINTPGLLPEAPFEVGMDVAWDSEDNVIRGTNYIGQDVMAIGRVSFQPSDLVDSEGNLSAAQQRTLQQRLNHIAKSGVRNLILNCDLEVLCNKDAYPNCDQNYANYYGKPAEWHKVIKASVKFCEDKGFKVVTVSPVNEPDYPAWKEGTQAHFKAIAKLINEDPEMAGIRVSAGNTLNCDQAASWYSYMKPYVQEGNTHQLAGSFDSYASFWQTLRADGNHATADEMHNVGEAFIGVHYGLQSGVWWGWEGQARGEYCRAAYYGKEIGYGENRDNWTAACVYKRRDGRMDAFLGVSERQASTTSYEFFSLDKEMYYDGVGPVQNFGITMPGGTGYATEDQRNAERMIQLHTGEDVPIEPIVAGQAYVIMNVNSGKCLGFQYGNKTAGTSLAQTNYTTKPETHQQWKLVPLNSRYGGDFGYYYMKSVRDTTFLVDLLNWGTAEGVGVCGYPGGGGGNEHWAFEYAGNGDWYIRSHHSGLYIEVPEGKTLGNVLVKTARLTGEAHQRWRLIPVDAALDMVAPSAPTGVTVVAQAASAKITWNEITANDRAGYMVYRGTIVADGDTAWSCIGRMIEGTEFVDNAVGAGRKYAYKLRAVDKSRNLSVASEIVDFDYTQPAPGLIAHYSFEGNLQDESENMLDAVCPYAVPYNATAAKDGAKGVALNSQFLLLPPNVASSPRWTFAAWVKNTTVGSGWQRIFDFGNGTDQYLFLTPYNGSEMRFVMKNGGDEEVLSATKLGTDWHHVAVTIGDEAVTLYVDGVAVATSTAMKIRPSDIRPVVNYIGRSQYKSDPVFRGYIDDVRIYNFELTANDIAQVKAGGEATSGLEKVTSANAPSSTRSYNLTGVAIGQESKGLIVRDGKVIFVK